MPKSVSPNGRGTIWAWPSTMATKNDQWCRDNTIRPVLSMQAHSAPLGITFFNYSNSSTSADDCPDDGGFPKSMNGNAFIAFHGSWNRNPPTGYKVVRVPMGDNGNPTVDEAIDFFVIMIKVAVVLNGPMAFVQLMLFSINAIDC